LFNRFFWMNNARKACYMNSNDSSFYIICPKCRNKFSDDRVPRSLDCGHSACTECARVYKQSHRGQPFAECSVCNNQTKRKDEMDLPVNSLLLNIARQLIAYATQGKIRCETCDGHFEEKDLRLCLDTQCAKFRRPACIRCFFEKHDGHRVAKYTPEVHSTFHGVYKKVDHSNFADRRIIDAQGTEFIVSASYLSSHSPYFLNLFYGSPEAKSELRLVIDVSPETLSDLLNLVYPSPSHERPYNISGSTVRNCCDTCQNSASSRLKLAIQLELNTVIDRITLSMDTAKKIQFYDSFNDNWESFKKYALPCYSTFGELKKGLNYEDEVKIMRFQQYFNDLAKDKTKKRPNVLYCYRNSPDWPDSRIVHVGETSFLVSASVLSLFSPLFVDFFYGNENRDKTELNLTLCDMATFAEFLKLLNGNRPKKFSRPLIRFMKEIKAEIPMAGFNIV
ncbi:hypothetical protein PFISCL1PPCAC_5981, partial [Pristionchus fissidentatus]